MAKKLVFNRVNGNLKSSPACGLLKLTNYVKEPEMRVTVRDLCQSLESEHTELLHHPEGSKFHKQNKKASNVAIRGSWLVPSPRYLPNSNY